ncbi:hypothetical protein PF006_g29122 [Phytophthora fragariae]|uniref:Uncharacterized protein n=2 Tax=Phytophthora fragariae TaxID=53985 RepID=A0A6A3DHS9_9STRA|nr:hypothetical protein PF009_g29836 [Phytophthora fragariae]KAE9071562.1 hypothetical protein PF006_g29122 [Phytophthora fragariae]
MSFEQLKISAPAASATRTTRPPLQGAIINGDGEVLSIVGSPSSSPIIAADSALWTSRMETQTSETSNTRASVDDSTGPPRKKARRNNGAGSSDFRLASEQGTATSTNANPTLPSAIKSAQVTKKTHRSKSKTTTTSKKVKAARSKSTTESADTKSMRWTVPLTKLALETRFKDRRILKKFANKTSDTKQIRATWEATVNVFLERALIEGAWGDGEEGRDVSVAQFKNKLNAIRKAYKAKHDPGVAIAAARKANEARPDPDRPIPL